jgi:hypothetical protein
MALSDGVRYAIQDAVCKYLGDMPDTIEIVQDPHNSAFVAIKVVKMDKEVVTFLLELIDGLVGDYLDLEEAMFDTWPPNSNPKDMYRLDRMSMS